MLKTKLYTCCLILMAVVLSSKLPYAQIIDNFTDGNIHENPSWYGDTQNFEVVAPVYSGDGSLNANAGDDGKVLRSKQGAGSSVLVTESNYAYGEWIFCVADGRNWAVSGTNDYKIVLISNDSTSQNLKHGSQNFNGYYLRFDGSNADRYVLYRQTGTVSTIILHTGYPETDDGNTPIGRRVRVTRDTTGLWSIYIDEGFNQYPVTLRGIPAIDNTHTISAYFGIVTNITNPGNARVLYFDNLYIGDDFSDSEPPQLLSTKTISLNQLELVFNEALEKTIAEEASNYMVDRGIGHPELAIRNDINPNIVLLTFSNNFQPEVLYALTVSNVADTSGNAMQSTTSYFTYHITPAVLEESFDDGDFFFNPEWFGNIGAFIVNPEKRLQLYTALPGSSYLSTDVFPVADSIEWQFWVNLDFDPSTSNFLKFFLASEKRNLSDATNSGYYIYIGETGAIDAINLYYTNGTQNTLIAKGSEGLVAVKPKIRIRVVYNKLTHLWSIEADAAEGYNFAFEASGTHSAGLPQPFYLGPLCTYTSLNTTKFFFDDIYCGPIIVDTIPPRLLSADITGQNSLLLHFSEKLDTNSSSQAANYNVLGFGQPYLALADSQNTSQVYLFFGNNFPQAQQLQLTAHNITDLSGNINLGDTISFFLYNPVAFDVVINEIFTDQTPLPANLPAKDYLELYNTTSLPLNLSGWTIQPRTTSARLMFPDINIEAGGYLIVCGIDDINSFSQYGKTAGISGFYMNNEGTISLRDASGNIIHHIEYTTEWYNDKTKASGGWAMEQIDPLNPCGKEKNWRASIDPSGGTPGRTNSVNDANPDVINPYIKQVSVEDEYNITVIFNEALDSLSASNPNSFHINNGIGHPILAEPIAPNFSTVKLFLGQALERFTTYLIEISPQVNDCYGNPTTQTFTVRFGIPEICEPGDILINEILYNPLTGGRDYIEVYNHSQKIIDVGRLQIGNFDTIANMISSTIPVFQKGFLLFPAEYALITDDTAAVLSQYYTPNPNGFIETEKMPSMTNSGGTVTVIRDSSVVIDMFTYHPKMQLRLLSSDKGVSLERISFDMETNSWDNWQSAASTVGYGTPAYQNSQRIIDMEITGEITVYPEIFSPDNDGYNDFLHIGFKFDTPGFVANVAIYSPSGRKEKILATNKLLGTEGVLIWDGVNDMGEKSRTGIYVIYFEVFDLGGTVRHFKKTCVLGGKP